MFRKGEAAFHDYRDCIDLDLEACDDILVGDIVFLKSYMPLFPRYGINMCILNNYGERILDTYQGYPPHLSQNLIKQLKIFGVKYNVAARKVNDIFPQSAREYIDLQELIM